MRPFAVPLTIAAALFVLAALPSFFMKEYADIAVVLSNFAYAIPFAISYFAQNFDFVLTIVICAVISILYHGCRTWGVCFRLQETAWESIDVAYSWYLLMTLVSFFALNTRFLHAAPLHVALIIWGSHAHCHDNYDCRSYKAIVVCIYLAFVVLRIVRTPRLYDLVDLVLALSFFVGAASIYLFFNTTAGHTLWHIVSAIGICFLITCFSDSPFHTLGYRMNRLAYETIVPRADI